MSPKQKPAIFLSEWIRIALKWLCILQKWRRKIANHCGTCLVCACCEIVILWHKSMLFCEPICISNSRFRIIIFPTLSTVLGSTTPYPVNTCSKVLRMRVFLPYWKLNFPITWSVRLSSVGWSVGWSVCHNFLKEWEVSLPCSYRSFLFKKG